MSRQIAALLLLVLVGHVAIPKALAQAPARPPFALLMNIGHGEALR